MLDVLGATLCLSDPIKFLQIECTLNKYHRAQIACRGQPQRMRMAESSTTVDRQTR